MQTFGKRIGGFVKFRTSKHKSPWKSTDKVHMYDNYKSKLTAKCDRNIGTNMNIKNYKRKRKQLTASGSNYNHSTLSILKFQLKNSTKMDLSTLSRKSFSHAS